MNASGCPPTADSLSCEDYIAVITFIHGYAIPGIVIFGLIGNVLAATIFLSSSLKSRSSSVYLGALSIADFGYLLTLGIAHLSYVDVLDWYNTRILCPVMVYISNTCSNLSVWLIVAFTAERFIAVRYPLVCPRVCTVARARSITYVIVFIACTTQLYIFWMAGVNSVNGSPMCDMRPEFADYMMVINYLDTFFALILPLLLILVLNALIVHSLMMFKGRLFGCDESASRQTSYNENEGLNSYESSDEPSRSSSRSRNISLVHHEHKQLTAKCQLSITKMLLLVSTVFIILNVPSYAIRLYVFALFSIREEPQDQNLICVQWILMSLFYLNFSINFLLYSVCAATFRKALITVLHMKLQRIKKLFRFLRIRSP